MRRLPHSRLMVAGPSVSTHLRHAVERQHRAGRGGNERGGQRLRVGALAVGQAHHQREAALAFANFAHPLGADGFDDVEDVARRHAVARNGLRVHFDLQHGLAGELFAGDFAASGNVAQDLLHLVGELAQLLQIVAVDFDADVGADAGDQFVEAHFNRLAEGDSQAGDFDEELAHLLHQFGLGVGLLPLVCAV